MKAMPSNTQQTINHLALASHDGEINFGQLVMALIDLGVESYVADYRTGATTYYLPTGETHAVELIAPEVQIPEVFNISGVQAAIKGAQSGEVKYVEFMQRTMAAGCVGYTVWISGRHVQYFGRRGDVHIEHFPKQA